MKAAVLGAGGIIAPAIVRDLGESDEVSELSLLDMDAERAQAVADGHGGGKATASRLDARVDGALAAALAGSDVLVNSASYRINLDAMRACLAARCHYIDLGGLFHVTGEQLRLSAEFEAAGLTAILGVGSAPGKTNLMAKLATERLGGAPDSIDVSAAGRDLDPPEGFSIPYALQTLIDELTLAPIVLRDGEVAEVEPMSDGGAVDFGDPIGTGETIYTLHSEMRTFGTSFGCRSGSFRLSLSPAVLERLRELRDASDEQIAAAARTAVPASARTVSVHVIDARKGGDTVRVRAVTSPNERWGIGGGIVSTATPAAAAVRLLARGSIVARGALPPEGCIDPEEMFAELEQRGAAFEVEQTEGVVHH